MITTDSEERCPVVPDRLRYGVQRLTEGRMTPDAFKRILVEQGVITRHEAAYPDLARLCVLVRLPGGKYVLVDEDGEVL